MIVFNVILLDIVLKITDVKIQLCDRLQALISCWVFWRKTSILIVLLDLNWNHPSRILNKIMGRYQIVLVHMDNYFVHFSNCRILTIFIFQVWLWDVCYKTHVYKYFQQAFTHFGNKFLWIKYKFSHNFLNYFLIKCLIICRRTGRNVYSTSWQQV